MLLSQIFESFALLFIALKFFISPNLMLRGGMKPSWDQLGQGDERFYRCIAKVALNHFKNYPRSRALQKFAQYIGLIILLI